jgi:hypothetical protein
MSSSTHGIESVLTLIAILIIIELSISEPKETKPTAAVSPAVAAAAATSKTTMNVSTRQTTIPRPADPPTIQYAAAAAANLPVAEPSQTSNITASPSLAAAKVEDAPATLKDQLALTPEPSAESAVNPVSAAGASAAVATPPMDEAKTHSAMSTPFAANSIIDSFATTTNSTDITSAQPSRSQSPVEVKKKRELALH